MQNAESTQNRGLIVAIILRRCIVSSRCCRLSNSVARLPKVLLLLGCALLFQNQAVAQLSVDTLSIFQRNRDVVRTKDGHLYWIANDSIFHSGDGCTTWEVVQLPEDIGKISSGSMDWRENGAGLLTWKSTDSEGLTAIAWTDDYGKTWEIDRFDPKQRTGIPEQFDSFKQVQRINDSTMMCIITFRVYKTTDRGSTFEFLPAPHAGVQLRFDGPYGWLWNWNNGVSGTTDGGQTWVQRTLPVYLHSLSIEADGITVVRGGYPDQVILATKPWGTEFFEPALPTGSARNHSRHIDYLVVDSLHQWFYSTRSESESYMYITENAGEQWFRTETIPNLRSGYGLQAKRAIFFDPSENLIRITLDDERPFNLKAKNTSLIDRPSITLTWTDPSSGMYSSGVVERLYVGGGWVHVGSVQPPDQYFIDETVVANTPVRYRVTLLTPEGSMRQISDTLTALPDVYVNLLSYILQPRDEPITFRYPVAAGGGGPEANILTCTYRGYVDSSRWERVHTFEVTVISSNGDTLRARDCLHEYRGPEPSIAQPCGFPSFGILGFERLTPLEIDNDSNTYYRFSEPFQCYHPAAIFADLDSMHFASDKHLWANPRTTFTGARGKGVIRKHYSRYEIDEMGWEHSTDVRWERIGAANSIGARDVANASTPVFVYPNPVITSATIQYSVRSHGPLRISVHDMLGREVAVVLDAMRSPGMYSAVFDVSALAAGMYICRLTTAGGSSSTLLQRLR